MRPNPRPTARTIVPNPLTKPDVADKSAGLRPFVGSVVAGCAAALATFVGWSHEASGVARPWRYIGVPLACAFAVAWLVGLAAGAGASLGGWASRMKSRNNAPTTELPSSPEPTAARRPDTPAPTIKP
jgi:hypothetical protein